MAMYQNLSDLWAATTGICKGNVLHHQPDVGFAVTQMPLISVRLPPSRDVPFSLLKAGPWYQGQHRLLSGHWSVDFNYEYLHRLAQSGDNAAREIIARAETLSFQDPASNGIDDRAWSLKIEPPAPAYQLDMKINLSPVILAVMNTGQGEEEGPKL